MKQAKDGEKVYNSGSLESAIKNMATLKLILLKKLAKA
jgi:hypothetical protein